MTVDTLLALLAFVGLLAGTAALYAGLWLLGRWVKRAVRDHFVRRLVALGMTEAQAAQHLGGAR